MKKLLLILLAMLIANSTVRSMDIHAAANQCNLERMQQILGANPLFAQARDENQNTPLHLVAGGGDINSAALLLQYGADVNARGRSGLTPLHWAAYKGHTGLTTLFLGMTLLEVDHDFLSINAEINARDTEQNTSLHFAAFKGYRDIAMYLLSAGAEINAHKVHRMTPLHCAAVAGNEDIARALLEKAVEHRSQWQMSQIFLVEPEHLLGNECYVDDRDNWGYTALHLAVSNGHLDVVATLLQHGADVNALDNKSRTPLHWAAHKGRRAVMRVLFEYRCCVNVRDYRGFTPLQLAR